MSITRRQFLISTTSAGAGLILPSYYDKVFSFFENHGEPLLEAPPLPAEDLYAEHQFGSYELNIGLPAYGVPEMTWREFITRYTGSSCLNDLENELGISEADLDQPAEREVILNSWARSDSPNAKAYYLLEDLDIGSELQHENAVGGLLYYDGACPGNDYLGVHAQCAVSLSLLQHRLNELQTGIRVLPV